MLELSGKIQEKGMKYEPMLNAEIAIDTIYNFYRRDNKHIFSSLSFFGLFGRDGFKNSFNGTLQVDSVFFMGNEKHISITYIPKKSDTITYEAYESSTLMYGDLVEDESNRAVESIKVVSTSQYNSISRFVINLEDFALVEYYLSYNFLGEPEKFDITVINFIRTSWIFLSNMRK
jgi:hypothetical protein